MKFSRLCRLFPDTPRIFSLIFIFIFTVNFLGTFWLFYFGMISAGIRMLILGVCLLILSIIFLKKIDTISREENIKFLNEMERNGRIADREIERILEKKFGIRRKCSDEANTR